LMILQYIRSLGGTSFGDFGLPLWTVWSIVNGKIKFPNYGSENSSDLLKTFAFCFFDWIDSEELG
jgi:hypothetical protein